MVAKQNLTVYQGADYERALEFKDESAVLMDLTGYTLRGQARAKYSDAEPAFSFTFTLRNQVSDTGLVDMLIPASATSAVSITKDTKFIYDIEWVNTSDKVKRLIEGELLLKPEVTK